MADVLAFLDFADALGVDVWLDGGWGVDACLGRQTRRHRDLDIVVERRHVLTLVQGLAERGYRLVPTDDIRSWNFVLGDDAGRLVDVHVIAIDALGRGVYGPPANEDFWPSAQALSGTGTVGGRTVRCTTPESQVASHTGYAVDAEDWADVSALCARFGIPVPED